MVSDDGCRTKGQTKSNSSISFTPTQQQIQNKVPTQQLGISDSQVYLPEKVYPKKYIYARSDCSVSNCFIRNDSTVNVDVSTNYVHRR